MTPEVKVSRDRSDFEGAKKLVTAWLRMDQGNKTISLAASSVAFADTGVLGVSLGLPQLAIGEQPTQFSKRLRTAWSM